MAMTAPSTPGAAGTPGTRAERARGRELRAERARLLQALRVHAEAERALGESQGGAAGWGQEASVASDLEAEQLLAALDHEERCRLADVEAALRRLTLGHYGTCEGCGRPIPSGRLHALPWARRCIACAARLESERRSACHRRRRGQDGRAPRARRETEGGLP